MDKINKKIIKIIGIILAIFLVISFMVVCFFMTKLGPVDSSDDSTITFVVESGMSKNAVIDKLEESDLIKNSEVIKLYAKLNNTGDFLAGTYELSKSMDASSILNALVTGDAIKEETISITFVEGKRFPYYVTKIAENFSYSEDDIYNYINEEYLKTLINKYWFIDESVLNTEIYYPLEGYLFPDTYEFKKDAKINEILEKMIDELGNKLEPYKDEISVSNYSVHSLLTLASVVELEAVTAEDRGLVSGVLYNRLNAGILLGCDVTTYYGAKVEQNPVNFNKANVCNSYNTRSTCVKGLPVGPICSPSLSSIVSAIEPTTNDYYYFVADKNNKVYFGKKDDVNFTSRTKRELCSKNLWPDGGC